MNQSFEDLHIQWAEAPSLRGCSSASRMAAHPAYRQIVARGDDAVRWILRRFKDGKIDHYFIALHEITGEMPVTQDHLGKIAKMAEDWVKWGQTNGFVE